MAGGSADFEASVGEIQSMFPQADREVIVQLLRDNKGQVNDVIDIFLQDSALSGTGSATNVAPSSAPARTESKETVDTSAANPDDAAAMATQTMNDEELARQLQSEEDEALAKALYARERRESEQAARASQQGEQQQPGEGDAMGDLTKTFEELKTGAANAFGQFAKFVKTGVQNATTAIENIASDVQARNSTSGPSTASTTSAAPTPGSQTRVPVHRYSSLPGEHEDADEPLIGSTPGDAPVSK